MIPIAVASDFIASNAPVLHTTNNAVTDRRLRPRKSNPVRPLACNWYYCASFIAKPKAACALRFSWAATSTIFGLRANNL